MRNALRLCPVVHERRHHHRILMCEPIIADVIWGKYVFVTNIVLLYVQWKIFCLDIDNLRAAHGQRVERKFSAAT